MVDPHTPSSCRGKKGRAGCSPGHLFIVSAPSGAGKSTLCRAVRRLLSDLAYSVSYTTRPPRPGEKEGIDYHFVSEKQFREGIEEKRWAEWARVHGNYYGSAAQWVERTLMAGRDILMDIDLQGAGQMVQRFPEAVTIFIMPPSLEELEHRLRKRGTEDQRDLDLRLANAKQEIEQRGICRHVIVNDDLDQATHALVTLIAEYRRK
jgi:guanylate kinase